MPKGRPRKIHEINPDDDAPYLENLEKKLSEPKYANSPTDFDQVSMFQQLFANLVERNRSKSIGELLDYLLSEGGVSLDNQALCVRLNRLGLRPEMRTPGPEELPEE